MKSNSQKQKEFENAYALTKSIVALYQKLAELELDGKKDTKEYQEMIDLLEYAIKSEKRSYEGTIIPTEIQIFHEEKINESGFKKGFRDCSQENLASMRMLNHFASKHISITAIEKKNEKKNIVQDMVDSLFVSELQSVIKDKEIEENIRKKAIKMKYFILSTTKVVEEQCLKGEFYPTTNAELNELEIMSTTNVLHQEISRAMDYFTRLYDDALQDEDVLKMLYIKSCLMLVAPLVTGTSLQELENTLFLARILAALDGKSNRKVEKYLQKIFLCAKQVKVNEK